MAARLRRMHLTPALVLVVFAALAVLVKLDVWTSPTTRYAGSADAQQMMWFLSWPPFAVSHHLNPLLSTYINYPTGFNMLWNTTMPALGLLFWPVTAIWGAAVTYNVIMTAAMALSAFFAFLVIRRYVKNDAACFAGALLFGFSPGVIAQEYGHAQVAFSAVTIPLMLLVVDELLVRQRLPVLLMGALAALLAVFQFFVFQEFFVTEILAAAVLAVVLAVVYHSRVRAHLPYAARALGIAAVIAGVVLAYPVLAIQIGGPDRVSGVIHDPNTFSTDLLNPVVPTPYELLAPDWVTATSKHFSGNPSEADGYIGIPLVIASLFVLVRYWKVRLIRVAGVSAIIITILSMGPHLQVAGNGTHIPLPWWPFAKVPLIQNILPSRMMYLVYLPLAVMLAFLLARVWSTRVRWLAAPLAVVLLVPLIPKLPLFEQTLNVPAYFTTAAVQEIPQGTVAFTNPFPEPWAMDPMDWQFASGLRFKLVGGYVLGPLAGGQDALMAVANAFSSAAPPPPIPDAERAEFLSELSANHVGAVIVGPVPHQPEAVSFYSEVLGSAPRVSGGVAVWVLPGPR